MSFVCFCGLFLFQVPLFFFFLFLSLFVFCEANTDSKTHSSCVLTGSMHCPVLLSTKRMALVRGYTRNRSRQEGSGHSWVKRCTLWTKIEIPIQIILFTHQQCKIYHNILFWLKMTWNQWKTFWDIFFLYSWIKYLYRLHKMTKKRIMQ